MSDYAKYRIADNEVIRTARLYMSRPDDYELSPFELEIEKVIEERIIKPDLAGKYGYTIDPYKAAISILADHYGYAEMIETHYVWEPEIVY